MKDKKLREILCHYALLNPWHLVQKYTSDTEPPNLSSPMIDFITQKQIEMMGLIQALAALSGYAIVEKEIPIDKEAHPESRWKPRYRKTLQPLEKTNDKHEQCMTEYLKILEENRMSKAPYHFKRRTFEYFKKEECMTVLCEGCGKHYDLKDLKELKDIDDESKSLYVCENWHSIIIVN